MKYSNFSGRSFLSEREIEIEGKFNHKSKNIRKYHTQMIRRERILEKVGLLIWSENQRKKKINPQNSKDRADGVKQDRKRNSTRFRRLGEREKLLVGLVYRFVHDLNDLFRLWVFLFPIPAHTIMTRSSYNVSFFARPKREWPKKTGNVCRGNFRAEIALSDLRSDIYVISDELRT